MPYTPSRRRLKRTLQIRSQASFFLILPSGVSSLDPRISLEALLLSLINRSGNPPALERHILDHLRYYSCRYIRRLRAHSVLFPDTPPALLDVASAYSCHGAQSTLTFCLPRMQNVCQSPEQEHQNLEPQFDYKARLSASSAAAAVKDLGIFPDVLHVYETLSSPVAATPRIPWLYALLVSSTMISNGSCGPVIRRRC